MWLQQPQLPQEQVTPQNHVLFYYGNTKLSVCSSMVNHLKYSPTPALSPLPPRFPSLLCVTVHYCPLDRQYLLWSRLAKCLWSSPARGQRRSEGWQGACVSLSASCCSSSARRVAVVSITPISFLRDDSSPATVSQQQNLHGLARQSGPKGRLSTLSSIYLPPP